MKQQRDQFGEFLVDSRGVRFRRIEAGEFLMGSPADEPGRTELWECRHRVRLTRAYWLADTPVTHGQWLAVFQDNPSEFRDDARPVENVSWHDANRFIDRLNELAGHGALRCRLPTEAEWEMACRAGSTAPFYWGSEMDPRYCCCAAGSGGATQPVRQTLPNAWGLYDMLGSVFEWCADWCSEDYYSRSPKRNPKGPDFGSMRVTRGASCRYVYPPTLRCAARYGESPDSQEDYIGFRCVQDVTP